jgi:anti-anti-sigma factor
VTLLSSAGLAVLAWAAQQARQRHQQLRIVVGEHRPVLRPIQIIDLDDVLTLCHNMAEALTV